MSDVAKMRPLVSIVMPIYKGEPYIARSVQSIIDQTYDNIELILVDDGSPDRSIAIAAELLNKHNYRYRLITQENAGQGKARNAGLLACSGDWVLFLDGDDLLSVNGIELMVRECDDEIDFATAGFNEIYDTDEAVMECTFSKSDKKGNGDGSRLCDGPALQEAFLYRKTVILAQGTLFRLRFLTDNNLFFEDMPWSEDQFFVWKVLHVTKRAKYIDAKVYQYLLHSNSVMNTTRPQKMIDSYHHYRQLEKIYSDNRKIGRYIVPRWVIGTLNSASMILSYPEWIMTYNAVDGKRNLKKLLSFKDNNVRFGAELCIIFPRMYYYLSRMRKRRRMIKML